MCTACISRRLFLAAGCAWPAGLTNIAAAQSNSSAGCVFYQTRGTAGFTQKPAEQFPGLRPPIGNAINAIAGVGVEFFRVFGLSFGFGLYDDSAHGPDGNASALERSPFPPPIGAPPLDGVVLLGERCLQRLRAEQYQFAAIAAVCAHEAGHLLQNRYVKDQLFALRNQDRSVVRTELHADFICGYYASVRKRVQSDWAAVVHVITQFKFGDNEVADPMHHGTPKQRGEAVQAGFLFANTGTYDAEQVTRAALDYVRSLDLRSR